MATKNNLPRPGAEVTLHGLWNWPDVNGVTVYFRRCEVVSFGAKQGAFRDANDSENVRHRIYPAHYTNVSTGHGSNAEVVAALVAEQVAHLESQLAWYAAGSATAASYPAKTVNGWKDALAALRAGRIVVADYADLRAAAV